MWWRWEVTQNELMMLLLLMVVLQSLALLVLLLGRGRSVAQPPLIVMSTPQPQDEATGCGGILLVMILALLGLFLLAYLV
jgi:hypothetical protein